MLYGIPVASNVFRIAYRKHTVFCERCYGFVFVCIVVGNSISADSALSFFSKLMRIKSLYHTLISAAHAAPVGLIKVMRSFPGFALIESAVYALIVITELVCGWLNFFVFIRFAFAALTEFMTPTVTCCFYFFLNFICVFVILLAKHKIFFVPFYILTDYGVIVGQAVAGNVYMPIFSGRVQRYACKPVVAAIEIIQVCRKLRQFGELISRTIKRIQARRKLRQRGELVFRATEIIQVCRKLRQRGKLIFRTNKPSQACRKLGQFGELISVAIKRLKS